MWRRKRRNLQRAGGGEGSSHYRLLTIIERHDLADEHGAGEPWPIHHVQEMLGHANLSQTSTLHASEMGLPESMRRFDAARGKPVANEASREQPPLSHDTNNETDKTTLH